MPVSDLYTWKKELRERLERENRWKAFISHREALKRMGVEEKHVWEQAAEAFPPLPEGVVAETPEEAAPEKPTAALTEDFINKTASDQEVVRWVADTLDLADVKPSDAPSAAAWNMRLWARGHKDRFYTQVFVKLMPTGKQMEDEGRYRDDGASIRELIAEARRGG